MPLPVIASGRWVELPGTTFDAFGDANGVPASLNRGGNGRSTIFNGWNSMVVDRLRKRVCFVRAGGHADYAGNGVYAFSYDSLTWSTLKPHFGAALNYGDAGYPPIDGNGTNQMRFPERIHCHSNNAADNRLATINGFNVAGAPISEVVQLQGTTIVLTNQTYRWVTSIVLSAANTLAQRSFFRYSTSTHKSFGIWPTTTIASDVGSTSTQVSRISGPFNLTGEDTTLGSSAYYLSTPNTAHPTEPSSVHTYDSQAHLENIDRYISAGGIWFGYGESTPQTVWMFNPQTNGFYLPSPGSTTRPEGFTCVSSYDPVTGLFWARFVIDLYSYDSSTNVWTLRRPISAGFVTRGKMVIDAPNRKLYHVSPTSGTVVSLYQYDISNINNVTVTQINPTGFIDVRKPGGSSAYEGLGAIFTNGRIAVYGNNATQTKGAVYSVDPNNPVWIRHDPDDGSGPPPPPASGGGYWNRFHTVDDIHYGLMHSEDDNVWVYKVPWSGATPFRPTGLIARAR